MFLFSAENKSENTRKNRHELFATRRQGHNMSIETDMKGWPVMGTEALELGPGNGGLLEVALMGGLT